MEGSKAYELGRILCLHTPIKAFTYREDNCTPVCQIAGTDWPARSSVIHSIISTSSTFWLVMLDGLGSAEPLVIPSLGLLRRALRFSCKIYVIAQVKVDLGGSS